MRRHSKNICRTAVAKASKSSSHELIASSRMISSVLSSNSINSSPIVSRRSIHMSSLMRDNKDNDIEDADFSSVKNQSEPEQNSSVPDAEVIRSTPGNNPAGLEETESIVGSADKHEFKAETRKLLEIVARSLYTDKEVFIRELISNASDALEKVRYRQLTNQEVDDKSLDLDIQITTDEQKEVIVIQDFGIGMSKEELIENLGTIAHSGTGEFWKKLENSKEKDLASLIGQFGVGFYSVFVVAQQVRVYTKSAVPGSKGFVWISEGHGSYRIHEAEGVSRGTKIVIELNKDNKDFCKPQNVENIIKKYSNFVGFPIKLNGEKVNTLRPLWQIPKEQITEEEHKKFYQFLSHGYDTPIYHLHYAADAPLSIRSVFYVPEQHSEKYGMGRMEPGVNLFSKKVLVQAKIKDLLPDWMRFIKGVVDCEDIPLHLSREHMQDTELIKRLGGVLTGRILRMLRDEAKKDSKKYIKFWREFGTFLKEGICTDAKWKEELGNLMRTETSSAAEGEFTSLEEYITRMKSGQTEIYFLCVPNRQFAETSPYFEVFKKKGYEVLFLYTTMDDFVMSSLAEFSGKKMTSIESASIPTDSDQPQLESAKDQKSEKSKLKELKGEELEEFVKWMKSSLGDKVSAVKETHRLDSSPAIIVDHESASFRRMMKFVDTNRSGKLPRQKLEINPKHPIIIGLNELRIGKGSNANTKLANDVADQVFDGALIAAGLLDDPRGMLNRLNSIMESALITQGKASTSEDVQEMPKETSAIP